MKYCKIREYTCFLNEQGKIIKAQAPNGELYRPVTEWHGLWVNGIGLYTPAQFRGRYSRGTAAFLPMKTVEEIFKIAGITDEAVFDSDHGSRMFDTGLLCGLWYGHVITYDEYRAASHALDILHWGMIQ